MLEHLLEAEFGQEVGAGVLVELEQRRDLLHALQIVLLHAPAGGHAELHLILQALVFVQQRVIGRILVGLFPEPGILDVFLAFLQGAGEGVGLIVDVHGKTSCSQGNTF